jgi:iron complex outermembrane receptor protein
MQTKRRRTASFWIVGAMATTALTGLWTESARAQSSGDDSTLEEVVVTARRRAENVQDVPISITQVSGAQLAASGIGDFRELDGVVPNMVQTGLESNVSPTISIRGIGSDARNIGFESGVSMYVDGVYTGRPVSWMGELVDVDSIEVLRGPQGTLFGKNTIAGAINITTTKPSDKFRASGELELGDYSLVRATASLSGPISDKVFVGVSGFKTERDGYQKNLFDGRDLWDKNDYGGRIQLRFAPSDNLDILLEADGLHEKLAPNVNTVISGLGSTAANGPRVVNINEPVFSERTIWGVNLNINYTLPNGGTLTSITAQRYNDVEFLSDDDGSPVPILFSDFLDEESQFTQEVRYASPSEGRFRYVVGAYYLRQTVDTDRLSRAPAGGLAPFDIDITMQAKVQATDYAVFGQADYDLTDALTLTAGLRYTKIEKDVVVDLVGSVPFGIISLTNHREDQEADAVSPTLSLLYKVNENLNAYATVSRGFKGGGFNADFVSNPNLAFDPEYVTNYEGGLKFEGFGRRLRANVAVYHMDYEDLQVSIFSPLGGFIIDNAATATINGVEFDMEAKPFPGLTLNAGVGYNDASFDKYDSNSGNQLAFSPKWTSSFGAQYRFNLGGAGSLTARGEYSYRSSYFSEVSNDPDRQIKGYGLVNARLTWASPDDRFQVQVWGENLSDKLYINDRGAPLGGLLGSQSVVYGKPRTWGVRLIGKF